MSKMVELFTDITSYQGYERRSCEVQLKTYIQLLFIIMCMSAGVEPVISGDMRMMLTTLLPKYVFRDLFD